MMTAPARKLFAAAALLILSLFSGAPCLAQTLDRVLTDEQLLSFETPEPLIPSAQADPGPVLPMQDCPYDQTHARECRVHWRQLFISSSIFNAFQNGGNLYTGYYYRYETTHGKWFDRYINSVTGYKFSVWSDGNPFLDDYVGHPMMGAITSYLWIQNDPRGMTLDISNSRAYWHSRLRSLAYATAYSTQWKLGPFGESGIGHAGDHVAYDNHRYRVETGFVSLVTTPVGGTLWTIAEDLLDKHVIERLENVSRNPFALFAYQFLSPARGTANILRFRPPWYRDSRVVKADSFWSNDSEDAEPDPDALPGGKQELGGWWGLSLFNGSLWGTQGDTRYMPIDVRYSYRLLQEEHWALRYSPEITALAMLDEVNWGNTNPQTLRRRTYGGGLSPEGVQVDFLPTRKWQPFLSNDGGVLVFADRVFSAEGSRYVYTLDFGGGVNIFRKKTQAVTIGYRYQHLSDFNRSLSNGSTDENTFYVGVSRFR